MENILIVSHEVVGDRMAGPGIRYYHLARVLSREFAVTLAAPRPLARDARDALRVVEYAPRDWNLLERLLNDARVVILPGILAGDFPQLAQCQIPIVIDGYDPYLVEWLAASQADRASQEEFWSSFAITLTRQYLVGDFFLCASERQRDWWLGLLEAHSRVNPWTFAEDAALRRLIDVVPFGLPADPPARTRRIFKGARRGIGENDRVILWGGGLWQWLDPLTAIRAVARVWEQRQDVRLIFPGARHPNPAMAEMPTRANAARALAQQLGLLDRAIFFSDWIAYADWQNVLLESDVALTLHARETLEARLAFRSRVLDYIWADVPIIATRGDATSELIAQNQIGVTVECGDVEGVARAIASLLDMPRENFVARFQALRPALTWERAAQPLIEFCRDPRIAPDKRALGEQVGNPFYAAEIARSKETAASHSDRRGAPITRFIQHIRSRARSR